MQSVSHRTAIQRAGQIYIVAVFRTGQRGAGTTPGERDRPAYGLARLDERQDGIAELAAYLLPGARDVLQEHRTAAAAAAATAADQARRANGYTQGKGSSFHVATIVRCLIQRASALRWAAEARWKTQAVTAPSIRITGN